MAGVFELAHCANANHCGTCHVFRARGFPDAILAAYAELFLSLWRTLD